MMKITKELNLSVHDLIDFLFRTGDIDNRVYNQDTMNRGTLIHANYQKLRMGDYLNEYYLKTSFEVDDFSINLEGRADGIYNRDIPIIEELKSTVDDLNNFYNKNKNWHLSQAITYAYMFLKEKHKEKCIIRLVYISQIDDKNETYDFPYDFKTLNELMISYLKDYLSFYQNILDHQIKRNESINKLSFPFTSYRKGQKELIKFVGEAIANHKNAFIEASTGIGKTMSVIYPSIKAIVSNNVEKIFYLTAKNTGKDAAYAACSILKNDGLDTGVIYITAKEKICACPGASCNPDECSFAKDYYTKLKSALLNAIKKKTLFNVNEIKKITDEYHICPFEFSLDLSMYMDIVIADYNYFFDPIVHLERYFDVDASNDVVLIDEAHNLVDRSREMYSEILDFEQFKRMKLDYRLVLNRALKRSFSRVNKLFKSQLDKYEIGYHKINDISHETYLAFVNLFNNLNNYHQENSFHPSENSITFSRSLNRFIKLYDNHQDSDALFINKSSEENVSLHLMCLDPSERIKHSLNNVHSSILFSATLTPFNYYKNVLGEKENDLEMLISSPFPKNNFQLILASAKIKYKDRDSSLNKVINYIKTFINYKKGNYLIFSPSFEYLEKLKTYFASNEKQEIFFQKKEMDDYERSLFVKRFLEKHHQSVCGFGVVGGAFAEGIDLVADSLIGVIVIGVGLPTISYERNLIKDYYQSKELSGFSYAYKMPGINKVSQAVGRLIRSEKDVGAALLIDDRYLTNEYRKLFKKEWNNYEVVMNEEELHQVLKKFYK